MKDTRDTVVIGASAGGISALKLVLSAIDPDIPAAIFVTQHQSTQSGLLADALKPYTSLPVIRVDENQKIEHGCIYIAPPDAHLVVTEDHVELYSGPRENRSRPSIDVLFRTAAAYRTSRVIGVLLTGMLDDGIAGLEAIKRCGGLIVVQDPEEAEFPDLPKNAIDALGVDHIKTLAEITTFLGTVVGERVEHYSSPEDILIEAGFNRPAGSDSVDLNKIAEHVSLSCPDCGGPLWKVGKGDTAVYRCHIGHAMGPRSLAQSQAQEIERSLWVAVRSLTERASLLKKLAKTSGGGASTTTSMEFETRSKEAAHHAEQARQFLLTLNLTHASHEEHDSAMSA